MLPTVHEWFYARQYDFIGFYAYCIYRNAYLMVGSVYLIFSDVSVRFIPS